LRAIDRLLRVLDRLDKYGALEAASQTYDGDPHERLMAKINAAAQRVLGANEEKEAREASGEEAPEDPPDDAEDEAEEEKNSEGGDSALAAL
jgi:hypothetical protein